MIIFILVSVMVIALRIMRQWATRPKEGNIYTLCDLKKISDRGLGDYKVSLSYTDEVKTGCDLFLWPFLEINTPRTEAIEVKRSCHVDYAWNIKPGDKVRYHESPRWKMGKVRIIRELIKAPI